MKKQLFATITLLAIMMISCNREYQEAPIDTRKSVEGLIREAEELAELYGIQIIIDKKAWRKAPPSIELIEQKMVDFLRYINNQDTAEIDLLNMRTRLVRAKNEEEEEPTLSGTITKERFGVGHYIPHLTDTRYFDVKVSLNWQYGGAYNQDYVNYTSVKIKLENDYEENYENTYLINSYYSFLGRSFTSSCSFQHDYPFSGTPYYSMKFVVDVSRDYDTRTVFVSVSDFGGDNLLTN